MNPLTSANSPAFASDRIRVADSFARIPSVLLLAALGTVISPVSSPAASACPGIFVDVPNVRNSEGAVACALFAEPEGFPRKFLRFAHRIVMTKIEARAARCGFSDIQPGTYALAVIHDENLNGELDSNFFGVPTEGYGFSGAEEASPGAPSFSAARVTYDGQMLELTIPLHY